MSRLSLLILALCMVVAADDGVFNQIKSYFWSESDIACDEAGVFARYERCPPYTGCCLMLQGWVIFIIVSLLVSLLFSCICSIISCICCCGRRD